MRRTNRLVPALVMASLALAMLSPFVPRARAAQAKDAPIEISIDASEAPRRIIHAQLVIPAAPGPLTLYYPKWIPGEHGPNGPITDLVGLKISAAGKLLHWRRDEANMFAFHCQVPAEAQAVEVVLDYLSPPSDTPGFGSAASISSQLAVLNWNQFILYPKGPPMTEIQCRARLRVPAGWKMATALPIASQAGPETSFAPVTLETLIDSTVLCGAHFREIPIGPAGGPPHFLELAGDSEAAIELSPTLKAQFDRLVEETGALFGARHYKSYRFLVALSDHVAHFGEEHHECTDIRVPERTFLDDQLRLVHIGVFPHEFVHSWNGKYRRPADMITRDFQEPERTKLLWVYEGLTQYLGMVLTARCGFWTPARLHEYLASIAQEQQDQRGRSWRPLEDTAVAAQLLYGARHDWNSWRRAVDFYDEGILIWLEVDTIIRQKSTGSRSLDDFCRRFHGGASGPPGVKPYTLDDIAADLNAVAPYDWKAFLTKRVASTAEQAPMLGLLHSGWRLTHSEKASKYFDAKENTGKTIDLAASIGLLLGSDGAIVDIIPGKAAARAGLAPGMKLIAVNGRRWSTEGLKTAIEAAKAPTNSLELLCEHEEYFRTYKLDYHEGNKYPRLRRQDTVPDLLTQIIKPLVPVRKAPNPARTD